MNDLPDPLVGRPAAEQQKIRQLMSAFGEYNNILQQLANEGQGNAPAARNAEESMQKLMEQLAGFGIRGAGSTTTTDSSYSNR